MIEDATAIIKKVSDLQVALHGIEIKESSEGIGQKTNQQTYRIQRYTLLAIIARYFWFVHNIKTIRTCRFDMRSYKHYHALCSLLLLRRGYSPVAKRSSFKTMCALSKGRSTTGFLKMLLFTMSICVFVCVFVRHRDYYNYWRDMV